MKKILLSLMLLIGCMLTVAAGPLAVEEGSAAVLRKNVSAIFELDLDHSTFERKEDFKAWCGNDYDVRVGLMNDYFPEYFNEYNNGLKITPDAASAKYKMVLHVDEFIRKLGGFYGAKALMRINGDLTIIDLKTNETVCKIRITKLDGADDFVENDRFPKVMRALAKKLGKLK